MSVGSSSRSVLVRLRAEVADYNRRLDEAAQHTRKFGDETKRTSEQATTSMGRMVQSANTQRQSWEQTGRVLAGFGTITVAALGASAAAAIRWESDWTGVRKTVDGTVDELDALEGGLREMARTLPATHSEIAAVAEAAGQLGVRTKDILGFTRVMVDLGETTNLTAGEAATSIAQLMNVMRTAPGDVGRLGAALVALGNNGASTERDIVLMAQRIAGAGKIVGLTEAEVLALANALASVGIEVEAGGSAISRVLTSMAQDVSAGGVALDVWARTAGVSGERFAQTWKGAPAEALTQFVEGLGRMQARGEDVFGVLDELGLADVRVSRALLSMAGAGDLLADSLDLGAQAWADNTALAEEAGKRYDTTAAKIEIARNNINDAAISLGENLLPALASVAEGVADLAAWFGRLPEPIQSAITGLGGVVGVAALAGGTFLLVFPRLIETGKALRDIGAISPRAAQGLGRLAASATRMAGIAGAALAVGYLTAKLVDLIPRGERAALSVEETTNALLGLSEVELLAISKEIGDIGDAMDALVGGNVLDRLNRWGKTMDDTFGFELMGSLHEAEDQFTAIGQSLAVMVEAGNGDRAAELFAGMAAEAEAAGYSIADLKGLMPAYVDALAAVENQATLTDGSTEGLTTSYNALAGATEYLTEEQAAWRDEVAQVAASFVDLQGGYDAMVAKQQEWAQATADATESSKDSWEDYYDGFSVALDDWFAEMQRQVEAQNEWETNLLLLSGRVSQGVIDELWRMGAEGAPLVAQLVDATDEQFALLEGIVGERSGNAMNMFATTLDTSAPIIAAAAAQLGEGAAAEIAAALAAGTATVQQIMHDYELEIEGVVPQFRIDTTLAEADLRNFITDNSGRRIYVDLVGRTVAVSSGSGNQVARAGGGPVWGAGTETSDSIPSLLSTNEHVWSAREVRGAGGHLAVAELRALARTGGLHPVQTMRFAGGGTPAAWTPTGRPVTGARGDTFHVAVTADVSRLRNVAEIETWLENVRVVARQKAGVSR